MLIVDPAQNNAFKAINRAWKQGATVQANAGPSGAPIRYTLRGLSAGAQDELVESLCAAGGTRRSRRPDAPYDSRASACISRGPAAWTKDGAAGSSSSTASLHRRSPRGFQDRRSAQKIDVLIIADDARVPVAGCGDCVAAGATDEVEAGAGEIRPEYAYQLTARICRVSSSSSAAAAPSSV